MKHIGRTIGVVFVAFGWTGARIAEELLAQRWLPICLLDTKPGRGKSLTIGYRNKSDVWPDGRHSIFIDASASLRGIGHKEEEVKSSIGSLDFGSTSGLWVTPTPTRAHAISTPPTPTPTLAMALATLASEIRITWLPELITPSAAPPSTSVAYAARTKPPVSANKDVYHPNVFRYVVGGQKYVKPNEQRLQLWTKGFTIYDTMNMAHATTQNERDKHIVSPTLLRLAHHDRLPKKLACVASLLMVINILPVALSLQAFGLSTLVSYMAACLINACLGLVALQIPKRILRRKTKGREMERNKMAKSKPRERDVVRFQFEVSPDLWDDMKNIQELGGITTKRELLNNALTLFRWAALHAKRGNMITAVSPTGAVSELQMPCLENIALRSQLKIVRPDEETESEELASSTAAGRKRKVS